MMDKTIMKNIDKAKVQKLADLVVYQEGQIVSKTLIQNKAVSQTLFAFSEGEEISTHASHGDAMVQVLDGTATITIGTEVFEVSAGETIVMPADVPHAVEAKTKMKMLLIVVF